MVLSRLPVGSSARTIAGRPTSVVLTVESAGEKLTRQLVATLAEPFLRGTERIRTEHAHDGTLTLTPRAAGGLRVTVQLPAAPPHTGS